VCGLARNSRLVEELVIDIAWAEDKYHRIGKPARRFKNFRYATPDSWSRQRRMIGKAEHLAEGANPRFLVASLKRKDIDAKPLYERVYCARGEIEKRIKDQQLDPFADRTSARSRLRQRRNVRSLTPSISAASTWLNSPRSCRSNNASNLIPRISCSTPARPIARSRHPCLKRFQNRTDHALQTPDKSRAYYTPSSGRFHAQETVIVFP